MGTASRTSTGPAAQTVRPCPCAFPTLSVCVEVAKWVSSKRKVHLRGPHRMASWGWPGAHPGSRCSGDASPLLPASAAEARGCGFLAAVQSDPRRAPWLPAPPGLGKTPSSGARCPLERWIRWVRPRQTLYDPPWMQGPAVTVLRWTENSRSRERAFWMGVSLLTCMYLKLHTQKFNFNNAHMPSAIRAMTLSPAGS